MSQVAKSKLQNGLEAHFDPLLLMSFMVLLGLGVVMVASTTLEMSQARYGDATYLFKKQMVFIGLGLFSIWILRSIRLAFWERFAPWILVGNFVLLAMVLMPAFGHGSHGSYRWLAVGGITIQVSEFVKLAMIIYLAGYMVRHQDRMRQEISAFFMPLMVVAAVDVLLLLEPDFGAAVVLTAIVLVMLYLGGVRYIPFLMAGLVVVVALVLIAITKEYRVERIMAFLDPWSDPLNSGYQLTQSLIAIGDGGLSGVGLGGSVQKLFYLPEAHNDFVFAVLAEETGLLGVLLLLGAYFTMVWCSFRLAGRCAQAGMRFAQHLMGGCAIWFAIQASVSLGVNMGILPTKGLSLPFLSAGGSNLLASCFAIGLMMRVHLEYKEITARGRRTTRRRR